MLLLVIQPAPLISFPDNFMETARYLLAMLKVMSSTMTVWPFQVQPLASKMARQPLPDPMDYYLLAMCTLAAISPSRAEKQVIILQLI